MLDTTTILAWAIKLQVIDGDLIKNQRVGAIEEGFIQKPRQTVVVALWGKMATHMLLLRLCSRRIDKRRAGSKLWGIFVYYIFYNKLISFPSNVCSILAND